MSNDIDGYNLYFGLRDANLKTSRWLDLVAMSESLLKSEQRLVSVRYFTTRVRNDPAASARQSIFIDALESRGGIQFDYGHFLSKSSTCRKCGHTHQKNEEKKTDVNIAVRLLEDAFDDLYDVAILISGDSDLAPPISSIRSRFPNKTVIVAFPPKRTSQKLRRVAHAAFPISGNTVRTNRLPDPVITADGVELRAPAGWLPSAPSRGNQLDIDTDPSSGSM